MRQGFDILARRYRCRSGEIDVIAFESDVLVFVEVKTRMSRDYGEPWEFVNWKKQQSFRSAAEQFIAGHDLGAYSYRFDIVAVLEPEEADGEVVLYKNAF